MKNNLGSSLIEILFVLAISVPFIVGIVNSYQHTTKNLFSLKNAVEHSNVENKVAAYTSQIINEYDQHRINLEPIVHKNGIIKLANNLLNPVSVRTDSLRPKSNSDAITSYSLSGMEGISIVKADVANVPILYLGCQKFTEDTILDLTTKEIFLGLATTGVVEFVGKITSWKTDNSNKCYQLSLIQASGMLRDDSNKDILPFIKLIFPIERIYTLYLDQLGRLRFLSHKGADNIENQPIIDGLDRLSINKNYFLKDFLKLETVFTSNFNSKRINHFYINVVGRVPLYNLLLN